LTPESEIQSAPVTATLSLTGMTCASCAVRIEKALSRTPGVAQAVVNFATREAKVQFRPERIGPEDLVQAVASEGYSAKVIDIRERPDARSEAGHAALAPKLTLKITGMHCASCAARIEAALKQVPGVRAATVNLAAEKAYVEADGGQALLSAVLRAVEDVGYGATLWVPPRRPQERAREADEARRLEERALRRDLVVALVFGMPVAVISMLMLRFPHVNLLLLGLTLQIGRAHV